MATNSTESRGFWRRLFGACGRILGRHAGWIGRGLRGTHTKVVVVYLCFLAVLGGIALATLWYKDGPVRVVQNRQPPPVTPPPAGHNWVEVKTTGYCPCRICCGKSSDGHTAYRNRAVAKYPYGIAVEPKLIPYGTHLFVPGYGEYMVDDTGGAMRQSARKGVVHLDLRFEQHQQARNWGVQWHWIAVPNELQAARPNDTWRLTSR